MGISGYFVKCPQSISARSLCDWIRLPSIDRALRTDHLTEMLLLLRPDASAPQRAHEPERNSVERSGPEGQPAAAEAPRRPRADQQWPRDCHLIQEWVIGSNAPMYPDKSVNGNGIATILPFICI